MLPLQRTTRSERGRLAARTISLTFVFALAALAPTISFAQIKKVKPLAPVATTPSVLTYHGDNQRTGINAKETAFIPSGASTNLTRTNSV